MGSGAPLRMNGERERKEDDRMQDGGDAWKWVEGNSGEELEQRKCVNDKSARDRF